MFQSESSVCIMFHSLGGAIVAIYFLTHDDNHAGPSPAHNA